MVYPYVDTPVNLQVLGPPADPMTMMHAVHGAVLAVLCRAVHSEICRALLHARLEEAAAELPGHAR